MMLSLDFNQHLLTGFVAELRVAGIPVSITQNINFTNSIQHLGNEGLYWAGRTSLLSSPAHIPTYNKAFKTYWLGANLSDEEELAIKNEADIYTGDLNASDDLLEEQDVLAIRYSPNKALYEKDFAKLSSAELAEAKQAIAQMKITPPLRKSRRLKPSAHKTTHIDMGRTARRSLQTLGDPIYHAFYKLGHTTRRLVLLLDISGSMETYSRVMLRFAHSVTAGQKSVETFVLSTQITRITKELATKDPDMALTQVSAQVKDWSSGTRLAEGLKTFNNQWGLKGIARGATILIVSDGWDRGEPENLSEQMARLSRVTHKIIWVNPLKASPNYEPLAQGMVAALPWVDDFVEGHSLQALKKLAELIA